MEITTPVNRVPRVGPAYARRLEKLGIKTVEDLLYHFPFRYEDLTKVQSISEIQYGQLAVIKGSVWQIKSLRTRYGKFLTLATVNDGSGTIQAVWFNQPYITKNLKNGLRVVFAGKVDDFNHLPTLMSPEYEVVREDGRKGIHTERLVPVYPETAGISSKWLRSRLKPLLDIFSDRLIDFLPPEITRTKKLLDLSESIRQIHFPDNVDLARKARERLAFEELFLIQLNALRRKEEWKKSQGGKAFKVDEKMVSELLESLPFELTTAQDRCVKEILTDISRKEPMNRLLEGDVGSGKTIVAAIAMYVIYLNGFQSTMMAPTEILAQQHFKTVSSLLSSFGVKVGLQTGSKKWKEDFDILVGTHALLSSKVEFKNLGLIVIDEQHRFGVAQRADLRQKGQTPHILTMTATPIPRTMALTLYGDLNLSVIDEMPQGRIKIKTYVITKEKREDAYSFLKNKVKSGQQAFIICPLIEPSETLSTARSAKKEFGRLQNEIFPDLKLGLLHGQLKAKEKDEVLSQFRDKKFDILVATPVVEVGIDIPNATIMMVETSDRFGLAQLHQLRGRVGRGTQESFCLLFIENYSPEAYKRLKVMERHHLGIELAEIDLQTRGPGEIYGTAQHGIPNFKIASLTDARLIEDTRIIAEKILEDDFELQKAPLLKERLNRISSPNVSPD
ncbi:MAG: ATP-dependent DNA helicase RecG [Patescibacteria group bacterium]|nr:ATP-dependent DNA helicase RecG [Patescibacteria group bacterium]